MKLTVGALLVTYNSARHLPETIASIQGQSQGPDMKIAVDDQSTDRSVEILHAAGFTVLQSTTLARDVRSRIAHNFVQGVRSCMAAGADIVILGDHDDVWRPDRIAHQAGIIESAPWITLLASDGYLIDTNGVALPGTIRQTFPVPDDFARWTTRKRFAFAARHSLVTGGASAVRAKEVVEWTIPGGWLHDRWWTLEAVRAHALMIDDTPVIDYRISTDQEVGLDFAHQDRTAKWLLVRARSLGQTVRRARDVARLFRPSTGR